MEMITDAAEIKKRVAIVKPLSEVKKEQTDFFSDKLNGWLSNNAIVQRHQYEDVMYTMMSVPELIAHKASFRAACVEKGNQMASIIMTDPKKNFILKLWNEFIQILEEREDYMPEPPPPIQYNYY
jgi:hypothetical protein